MYFLRRTPYQVATTDHNFENTLRITLTEDRAVYKNPLTEDVVSEASVENNFSYYSHYC